MTETTSRGVKMLGLGVIFFLVAVALTATGNEGVKVIGDVLGAVALFLLLVGIVLALVGLFRRN